MALYHSWSPYIRAWTATTNHRNAGETYYAEIPDDRCLFELACRDSRDRPEPEGAKVYIIEPADGAEVTSPVTIRFGLSGMGVAPAGVEKEKTGHHHLIIDTKLEDYENPLPADDNHKHFGGGQTEATIELSPGKHTLQLILGDHNHVPHDPVVESEVITITVK